jgi:hypothetical protein
MLQHSVEAYLSAYFATTVIYDRKMFITFVTSLTHEY